MLERRGYPTLTPAEIAQYRTLAYGAYLQTPYWKLRRYARLRLANFTCEGCGRRPPRNLLNAHHRTYARLGEERDEDLEVLCRDCHEGHHFAQSRHEDLTQYIHLARETARLDKPTTFVDFKEAFRQRLQQLHLSANDHRFNDALTIVFKEQPISLVSAARRDQVEALTTAHVELPPPSPKEARTILARLKIHIPFRSFPSVSTGGVATQRAQAQARLEAIRCPQCHEPGGVKPSGMTPGSLWCARCRHKWLMTPDDAAALVKH